MSVVRAAIFGVGATLVVAVGSLVVGCGDATLDLLPTQPVGAISDGSAGAPGDAERDDATLDASPEDGDVPADAHADVATDSVVDAHPDGPILCAGQQCAANQYFCRASDQTCVECLVDGDCAMGSCEQVEGHCGS